MEDEPVGVVHPSLVYEAFNRTFRGQIVRPTTGDHKRVDTFAVLGARGPALALVNRSGDALRVELRIGKPNRGAWRVQIVDAQGSASRPLGGTTLDMPASSVAFVSAERP